MELPFRALVADRHALRLRGFATEDDLKLARPLNPKEVTKSTDYGMKKNHMVRGAPSRVNFACTMIIFMYHNS